VGQKQNRRVPFPEKRVGQGLGVQRVTELDDRQYPPVDGDRVFLFHVFK
jgi:hypothetical protein